MTQTKGKPREVEIKYRPKVMSYAEVMDGFRKMQCSVKTMVDVLIPILTRVRVRARASDTANGVDAEASFDKFFIKFLRC